MARVRAALKRAGIADKDIQTSSFNLNPEYRYDENQSPVLTGYRASNQVSVRFRDIKATGAILDALVAEGANQINGPSLTIDKPEQAMDEARVKAIAVGPGARRTLCAGARQARRALALGQRIGRLCGAAADADDARPDGRQRRRQKLDRSRRAADPGQRRDELRASIAQSG